MTIELQVDRLEQPGAAAILADLDRLRDIAGIDLANRGLCRRLDAIAAQTRAELGLPTSLVTLVLDRAQFIVGSAGLSGWIDAVSGTPIEWSFCVNAVITGEAYVIEDAARDPRQRANPLVTQDRIGSYCGVPLVSSAGYILGAHCVLGDEPHDYTVNDLLVLRRAGDEIVAVLDEYR